MFGDLFASIKASAKKTTQKAKAKNGTKSGTTRLRNSKAVPSKVQQRYGTRRQLLKLLTNHELGWSTDDNLLYIKVGRSLKPVATSGGETGIEIKGTSDEVIVHKDTSTGGTVYTISLAGTVEDALVPEPPQVGAAGKVLTANEDGSYTWQDPPVDSVTTVDL